MPTELATGQAVGTRAWCRADLAGGTLDIWPLGLLHPGARTVNLALDLAVEIEMEATKSTYKVRQGDSVVETETSKQLAINDEAALVGLILDQLGVPPVEVRIDSASPRGGGLGGSSALAVATIALSEAICGMPESSPQARAALARDLEARLMSLPTGRQDHFPAQLGGVLEVLHEPGGEQIRHLSTDVSALGAALLVAYSGQSHFSAGQNWRVIRNRFEADAETIRCLDGIRDAAAGVVEALEQNQLPEVGELMSQEWGWRRRLADGISTDKIEEILAAANRAGAWGGKVCGAGGGGCLAMLCPPAARHEVVQAVTAEGAEVLTAGLATEPLRVRPLVGSLS